MVCKKYCTLFYIIMPFFLCKSSKDFNLVQYDDTESHSQTATDDESEENE